MGKATGCQSYFHKVKQRKNKGSLLFPKGCMDWKIFYWEWISAHAQMISQVSRSRNQRA